MKCTDKKILNPTERIIFCILSLKILILLVVFRECPVLINMVLGLAMELTSDFNRDYKDRLFLYSFHSVQDFKYDKLFLSDLLFEKGS